MRYTAYGLRGVCRGSSGGHRASAEEVELAIQARERGKDEKE
jgi:hypothetical protein